MKYLVMFTMILVIAVNMILFGKLQERNKVVNTKWNNRSQGVWVSAPAEYDWLNEKFACMYVETVGTSKNTPVMALQNDDFGKKAYGHHLAFYVDKEGAKLQLVKDDKVKIIPLWDLMERLGY